MWSSKHPLISWATICLSKQEGGYRLRDLHAWNEALLSKTLWEIQSKANSLWVRWVHQHYIKGADFWQWDVKVSDSPLIKQLVDIRSKIQRATNGYRAANMMMIEWFAAERKGVANAYEFFKSSGLMVTWGPVVWRSEIMPKH